MLGHAPLILVEKLGMMRRMRLQKILSGFAAIVVATGLLAARQAESTSEGHRLDAMIKAYAAERKAAGQTGADAVPGTIAVDPGPAGSPAQAQRNADRASAFLKQLATIHTDQLTHDEWILYGMTDYDARMDAGNGSAFFWLPTVVTPYSSGLRTIAEPFQAAPLATKADLHAYLAALAKLPATMGAYQTRLRQQLDHGVGMPGEELRLVVPFVRSIAAAPPESAFSVSADRLSAFPPAEQAAFRKKVDAAITGRVNPAVTALAAYLDDGYRRHASGDVGLSQYEQGAAYYQYRIRLMTGLDLTPQQIHDMGLKEVTRINGELDQIRREVGYAGTLAEFKTYLRTDRRFYPKTADEIAEKMMAALRLIEPRMPEYLSEMPKAPYGVRRLAPELEPSMTYGIYSLPTQTDPKGYYNYNGLNPETRSITMVTAIIFHELLPGHHYQLNLRNENPNLTGIRHTAMYGAYTEGWGEYASDLAGEMGGYPDPYTRAGRLGMDLFVSSRLVLDTGMNALGWSRERAMQYMKYNTFEADGQVDTETLRYSTDMPAQALCYKLGALKIRELRERMRAAQGAAFDIRKFHRYLLDAGEMPLGMLDQHFDCLLSGEAHHGPM